MLTEVHRQAQDDPIIRLSMDVRAGHRLAPGELWRDPGGDARDLDPQRVIDADQVLVGRNATRRAYNARMRERRGFEGELPIAGDKLVCLRNNRRKGLFNGGLWLVKERPRPRRQIMKCISSPTTTSAARASRFRCGRSASPARSRSCDGRCARNSTSSTTAMCSPCTRRRARNGTTWCCSTSRFAFPDSRERWLYTGVTRAAKRLTVVV